MSSSSDMGLALQFVDCSIKINSRAELAHLLLETLRTLELKACIRLSDDGIAEWYQLHGAPSPLEKELIEMLASKDRIFSFEQRTQFNFNRINLLVKNMPIDEENKYGRIKELIPFLLESANARLQSISDSKTLADHEKMKIAVSEVNKLLAEQKDTIAKGQDLFAEILNDMIKVLEEKIPFMGLDDEQEQFLMALIESKVGEAGDAADTSQKTNETFQKITETLNGLLQH